MSCSSSMIRILLSDIGIADYSAECALETVPPRSGTLPRRRGCLMRTTLGSLEPLLQVPKAGLEAAADEEPEERPLDPREAAPPDVGACPIDEDHVGALFHEGRHS